MKNQIKQNKFKKGFTLLELLVVVLIIGVLAAIALPQYQKAVEKSKSVQGISLVKMFWQASETYYLTNGAFPNSIDKLDITLSQTQIAEFVCPNSIDQSCNKKEWGISSYQSSNGVEGIVAWRTSGPYKGGGFAMYYKGSRYLSEGILYCIERRDGPNTIAKTETYCPKIIKVKSNRFNTNNSFHYIMN